MLDLGKVALLLSKKPDWPKEYILSQINGRQKAIKKFPFLNDHPNFEFPNPTAVAQASSEITARFKASLVNGDSIADLSGGMGIDSYFFAKKFKQLTFLEKDKNLFKISAHNLKNILGKPIDCQNITAEVWLRENAKNYDWIYLDPDRRAKKSKSFQIETSSPNLIELFPLLFEKSDQLMVKLSPLLDLKEGLRKIPFTKWVYVIAVDGECKELLFLLKKGYAGIPKIEAVNLNAGQSSHFSFSFKEEANASISYSEPQKYLYEPNAAMLKSGGFKSIARQFKLNKLSENTHLYTSDDLIKSFPGRIIKVERMGKPEKKFILFANVVSRNFPLSAAEIRKKYQIKEGKNEFLYACTLVGKKKVFIGGERLKFD